MKISLFTIYYLIFVWWIWRKIAHLSQIYAKIIVRVMGYFIAVSNTGNNIAFIQYFSCCYTNQSKRFQISPNFMYCNFMLQYMPCSHLYRKCEREFLLVQFIWTFIALNLCQETDPKAQLVTNKSGSTGSGTAFP